MMFMIHINQHGGCPDVHPQVIPKNIWIWMYMARFFKNVAIWKHVLNIYTFSFPHQKSALFGEKRKYTYISYISQRFWKRGDIYTYIYIYICVCVCVCVCVCILLYIYIYIYIYISFHRREKKNLYSAGLFATKTRTVVGENVDKRY